MVKWLLLFSEDLMQFLVLSWITEEELLEKEVIWFYDSSCLAVKKISKFILFYSEFILNLI